MAIKTILPFSVQDQLMGIKFIGLLFESNPLWLLIYFKCLDYVLKFLLLVVDCISMSCWLG